MRRTPEQAVFADALLELGFEEVISARDDWMEFDRLFGEESFSSGSGVHRGAEADRGSTIEVSVRGDYVGGHYVVCRWITSWLRHAEGFPTYIYKFPEHWVDCITRLKQLIAAAELKDRTGVTTSQAILNLL